MHLYTVTVVADAPPDQNEGQPLRAVQYHACAMTSAEARRMTMEHHRAARPHDGQVRSVIVDAPCAGGVREAAAYPITPDELQRLEAGHALYRA